MIKSFNRYLSLLSNSLSYLIFHVTYKCNSKCITCFNWNLLNKNSDNELNLDEIKKISKSMGNIFYLTLSGGEPYLREDLPEICEIFYKNNNTKVFTITTNAYDSRMIYAATKKILTYCPNSLVKSCLSLDGLSDVHNQIRGVKDSFNKFLETYYLLKNLKRNKNFFLAVNTTFCKYNQDFVKEICDFVGKLEIDIFNVNLIRGIPYDKKIKDISIDKYIDLNGYINKKLNKKPKNSFKNMLCSLTSLTREIILENLNKNTRTFKCYAGRKFLVINPFGDVILCEPINKSFGNLRKNGYDIKKILASSYVKEAIKDIGAKKCSCTWECAIQNSLVYDFKNYPKLLAKFFGI